MQLPGRLDSTTLGDILGTLYRGHATGVLELSEIAASNGSTRHGRTHRIHLLSGLVAGVDTELHVTPIGEVLARAGKVDPRAIDVMLYRVALGDPRPAGAILVSMGAVGQDALLLALRAQLHAKVDAVYRFIADARIAFRTSRPLPRDVLRVGTLMPRDFLHGRQRTRERRGSAPAQTAARPAQAAPHATSGAQPFGARRPSWTNHAWFTNDTPPPASGRHSRERTTAPPPVVTLSPRAQALRTLGLPDDADEPTVRRAFKRIAMETHPDRFATSPEDVRAKNAARFAEASAAFHLLVA